MASTRRYKDYRIYSVFVLNQLVSALGIGLYQKDLEKKIDGILASSEARVTKADIMHEIKSNHNMTNKILSSLQEEGFVIIERGERSFEIKITREGVLHIREFNKFYLRIYADQIKDHYKYRSTPSWARE
jgi:predicted transcriptional regulator